MPQTLHRISEPEQEVFTHTDVKNFLKEDVNVNDADIDELCVTAREWIEDVTGLNFGKSGYILYADSFNDIHLPRYPLHAESVEVKYYDEAGEEQTLSSEKYILVKEEIPARLLFKNGLPSVDKERPYPVSITFKAGYEKSKVPKRAFTAMKLLITHYYNHRDLSDNRIDYSVPIPARINHFTQGLKKWRFH